MSSVLPPQQHATTNPPRTSPNTTSEGQRLRPTAAVSTQVKHLRGPRRVSAYVTGHNEAEISSKISLLFTYLGSLCNLKDGSETLSPGPEPKSNVLWALNSNTLQHVCTQSFRIILKKIRLSLMGSCRPLVRGFRPHSRRTVTWKRRAPLLSSFGVSRKERKSSFFYLLPLQ